MATLKSEEETKDTSQFRVVSNPPKSKVDILCTDIVEHADMSRLKDINFDELSREEKKRIEESIYEMMAKFKLTPLELDNTMPKEISSLIENKWHYCLDMERQIREATLANLFTDLKSEQIKNKVQKYSHKFMPKYSAFYILQKKTKELEERTTKIWKIIYSLVNLKPGQEDPFKEIDKGDEEEEGQIEKEEEEEEEEKEI